MRWKVIKYFNQIPKDMQRLTDIWRDLLGSSQQEQEEEERSRLLAGHLSQEQSQGLEDSYRNLYWSGLASMQQPEVEESELQPLAGDIIEAINELEEEEQEVDASWQPYFDP